MQYIVKKYMKIYDDLTDEKRKEFHQIREFMVNEELLLDEYDDYYEYDEYYFRYNTLYFSYRISGYGDDNTKYRQYFNSKGELIRNLIDKGDGNQNNKSDSMVPKTHFI